MPPESNPGATAGPRRSPGPHRTPDGGGAPAVVVDDLVVRYGSTVAVAGLSFEAAAGAVTAVLGPNGAGKTTTIETVEGYRRPDAGSVRVLGLDPVADHRALVPRIGVMLQSGGVSPGMRVLEAVRLTATYYDRPLDPAALVEQVGLGSRAGATWRSLSGGEQRRLALALALVGRPEVAFLDEPTSGVDVAGRQVIRRIVRRLVDDGVAVVLTTHELDEAERVADHLVIVDRGRVVASGTPEALLAGGDGIRFAARPGLDVTGLAGHLGAAVVEEEPGRYRVGGPASPAAVAALTAWLAERDLPLGDLQAGRRSLEDVFLRLVGDDAGVDDR